MTALPDPLGTLSGERYYAARDAFILYILDEVNPARAEAGLSEIREDEARECFRVLHQMEVSHAGEVASPEEAGA